MHLVIQRQKFKGVPARSLHLEVREEGLCCDICVYGIRVLELTDPCISNDGKDELCRLPSRCLVRRAVCALRLVCRFSARSDNVHSVVVDRRIVCPDSCRFGECRAVARDICTLRPNKTD